MPRAINGILFVSLTCLLLLGAAFVSANGGVVPDYRYRYSKVFAPEQKAAIFWDGSVERMILSTKITSDNLTSVAWLVPIQSSSTPDVQRADNRIFFDLANLFTEIREDYGIPGGLGVGAAQKTAGVEIVKTQQVDIYDITILRATDADSLLEWLNDNGFSFPERRKDALDYYVQKGDYYFVANKIDLLNKYPDATVGDDERACADEIYVSPDYGGYYGQDAEETEAQIASQIEIQFNETDECRNASFQAVRALVELRNGIATPLQFTFRPEKPFYPMEISSINYGSTLAEVYIFGKQCFEDSSQLLEFGRAVRDREVAAKYGFASAECVSLLRYAGANSGLTQDSFFTEKSYTPPAGYAVEPWGAMLLLILFLAIAVVPMLVVGVLTAHFAKKNRKRARRIHTIGIGLMLCAVALPGVLLFLIAPYWESVLAAVFIMLFYGVFPVGGFLSGYFAVKKGKWWIAVAGVAALAALLVAAAAATLLVYGV